jgi:predicted ABC-type transport system involved in lysophospholipase L1 biosynthesis ATPase subunit
MAVLEAELVERERELAVLRDVAAVVESGRARLVLLTGEAGIGKSALWSAFVSCLPSSWRVELVGGHRTDRSF